MSSRRETRRQERKERRKREKAERRGKAPSTSSDGAASPPPETPPSKTGFLFVGAAAIVIGAFFLLSGDQDEGPADQAAGADAPDLPAPESAEMTLPVRRAIETARGDVELDPSSSLSWGQYGEVLDAHHLFEDAAVCYRQAAFLAGDSLRDRFRWNYLLATVLNSAGGGDDEIHSAFRAAMAIEPDYPPGHVRHGDALVRMGRNTQAAAAFERAIALDADFAMAHRNLGQVLLADGELDRAIEHLETSARYDPSDSITQTSLARAYRQKGRESEAQEALARSRELSPVFGVPDPIRFAVEGLAVDPLSLEDRIDQAFANDDIDAAMAAMDLVEESFPDDAATLERVGLRRFKADRKAAAIDTLEKAIALDGHRHEARLHLAAIFDEKKEVDKALVHYEHVAEEDPENASLQQRIGYMYLAKNELETAVTFLLSAVENGLEEPGLNHNLGTALDRLDRTAEAVIYFERVLAVEPGNGGTHYNLGMALERLGKIERAIEHYDEAAVHAPGLPAKERAEALRAANRTLGDGPPQERDDGTKAQ